MTVTLRDVAERAGVSVRTASNVANNFAYVSATTRALVLQAIEELGYQPNLSARNLRTGRSGIIGVAVPELDSPYFAELCGRVIREVRHHSGTVIIEETAGEADEERALVCRPRRMQLLDGLILSPLGISSDDLARLVVSIPLVLIGERATGGPFDRVTIDNVEAARIATTHLIELGRRRVAAIGERYGAAGRTAQLRTQGYRAALADAGLRPRKELTVPTRRFHRPDGAAALERLIRLRRPPDALFCYNDLLALGAIRAAHAHGMHVPDDIAVIGFDDIEDGRYSTPTLTSISPDKDEIARVAVDMLFHRVKGDTSPPLTHTASCQLHIRESTATYPQRRAGEQVRSVTDQQASVGSPLGGLQLSEPVPQSVRVIRP